jgi:hypothetical protein
MSHKIYDRQAGETNPAFEAFALYRDMGINRSLDAVAKKLSKSLTLMGRWSGQHNWVERVSLYDDYLDVQARKKFEADTIKRKADMLKRHALTGKILQQKGVDYLTDAKKGIEKSSDAITAISKGIEIERKSEGLPEWIFEVVNADDNELARQYAELLASVGSDEGGDGTQGNGDPGTGTPSAETPAANGSNG